MLCNQLLVDGHDAMRLWWWEPAGDPCCEQCGVKLTEPAVAWVDHQPFCSACIASHPSLLASRPSRRDASAAAALSKPLGVPARTSTAEGCSNDWVTVDDLDPRVLANHLRRLRLRDRRCGRVADFIGGLLVGLMVAGAVGLFCWSIS